MAIAEGIDVRGPINIQFALRGDTLYTLEANPRASRTVPFVSKATGVPLAKAAALIMVGRTNAAQPGAGSSYSFDCMTAACLGGVSIAGGEGKISGTVIGVIILGILDNGLVLMSVNTNWQSVIKGLILLAAVAIDCYQVVNKNRKKAAA